MSAQTVAVIGAGQLARMMQRSAIDNDIHLRVLANQSNESAAQVVPDVVLGTPSDIKAVQHLCEGADVLTFEHEHIPDSVLATMETIVPVRPSPRALVHAQDKAIMRQRLTELEIPCPRWERVCNAADIDRFGASVGWPIIVKVTRGGYDGKGVRSVSSSADVSDWIEEGRPLIAEEQVPFTSELAVLLARRPSGITETEDGQSLPGQIVTWPVVETRQQHGVCAEVIAPAPHCHPEVARQAQDYGRRIAAALDVTGVLAVEMFVVGQGAEAQLYVNELAMRPHNSGHWTIDGAVTSQFEQHLRAVIDCELTSTNMTAPYAVMVNLLGSNLDDPSEVLSMVAQKCPQARIHLYGKEVRPGRKLGHVTVTGDDEQAVAAQARLAVSILRGENV